jgi:hypothetical protein
VNIHFSYNSNFKTKPGEDPEFENPHPQISMMEEYAVQLRILSSSQRIEQNQSLYMVTATIMPTKRSIKRIAW